MFLFLALVFAVSALFGSMQWLGTDLSNYPLVQLHYLSDSGPISTLWENGAQLPFVHAEVPSGQKQPVDLLFLLDTSLAMKPRISTLLDGIGEFCSQLSAGGVNLRLGLVTFAESVRNVFSFTPDPEAFAAWLRSTQLSGDALAPSAALDALVRGLAMDFRPGSRKVFVLVSDSSVRQGVPGNEEGLLSLPQVAVALVDSGVQLFCVGDPRISGLCVQASGMFQDVVAQPFDSVLQNLSKYFTSQYVVQFRVPDPTPARLHRMTLQGSEELQGEFRAPNRVQVSARTLQATGMGIVPARYLGTAQGWVLAREAAIIDAQRLLLETAMGVKLTAMSTLENSILLDRRIQSAVNGWISGAFIDAEKFDPNTGIYRATLHVDLLGQGGLIQFLADLEQYQPSMGFEMVNNFALSALSQGWVRATGFGAVPSGERPGTAIVKARNAAILDAQRRLLEILQGNMISSTVESLSLEAGAVSRMQTQMEGLLQSAFILDEGLLSEAVAQVNGLYFVQMGVSLNPESGVLGVLLNEVGDAPEFEITPRYQASPRVTSQGPFYGGLVLNALGKGFSGGYTPRIVDVEGNVLYSISSIGRNALWVMEYSPSITGAAEVLETSNPLVIDVVRVQGNDFEVSMEDAAEILRALEGYNFFRDGKVAAAIGG